MTYETYRYIFIGGAILSAALLVVTIVLFFILKIPRVFGDLTGRTAKKAIENIREQNRSTGNKNYKASAVNLERGKLTDKISDSGTIVQTVKKEPNAIGIQTEKISTQALEQSNETTVLNEQYAVGTDVFEVEFDITYVHTNEIIS